MSISVDVEEAAPAGDVTRVIPLTPDPSVLSAIGRGHSLESAVADLVDNALDAGASQIGIRFFVYDDTLVGFAIRDDGCGMNEAQLLDAMTLGKRRDYEAGALGHFGMGLKASSMSQAQVLTVYSDCGYEPVHAMRLTRDDAGGDFSVEELTEQACRRGIATWTDEGDQTTGTVVEWMRLDFASDASDPADRRAWLDSVIDGLCGSLGLTFHRLLAGGAARIEIDQYDLTRGRAGAPRGVDPVDPFAFSMAGKTGYPVEISSETPSGDPVIATCWIIPPGATGPASKLLGRPRIEWQGFYFYRNDRLLDAGGWCSLATKSADQQLARVVVEVDDALLHHVAINPEKHGVRLQADFVHALEDAVDATGEVGFRSFLDEARAVVKDANKRRRAIKPVTPVVSGLPEGVTESIGQTLGLRPDAPGFAIAWKALDPERLFRFDHADRMLWLNAGYRKRLTGSENGEVDDAPLLKTALALLLEGFFTKTVLHQSTIDKIEAWQRVLGAALQTQVEQADYDPLESSEAGHDTPEPEEADEPPVPNGVGVEARAPEGPERRVPAEAAPEPSESTVTPDPRDLGAAGTATVTEDLVHDYLRAVEGRPLLSAEDEVSLARRIEVGLFAEERLKAVPEMPRRNARELLTLTREGRDAMEEFVTANLRLVAHVARSRTGRGLALPDLIQEGNIGLIRAVQKFDFTAGTKFSTYAVWWIRQFVSRAIADQSRTIRVPVHLADEIARLRSAERRLARDTGGAVSAARVAEAAKVDPAFARRLLAYDTAPLSLDEGVRSRANGEDPGATLGDLVVDSQEEEITHGLEQAALREALAQVLAELEPREAEVLRFRHRRYGDAPETLDAIGERFGVTRERIRQIERKALEKLRDPAVLDRLADFTTWNVPSLAPGRERSELRPETEGAGPEEGTQPDPRPEPMPETAPDLTPSRPTPAGKGDAAEHAPSPEEVAAAPRRRGKPPLTIRPSLGWTAEDDLELVQSYKGGSSINGIARELGRELHAVAQRLTEILLPEAASDDETVAPRHGIGYAPDERKRLISAFKHGRPVARIAQDLGRTPLAIAWQLFNAPGNVVPVTKRHLKALRKAVKESS